MAATQTGRMVVHGSDVITIKDASGSAITGLANTNLIVTNVDYDPSGVSELNINDEEGALATIVDANPHALLSFDCIPVGSTVANAITAKDALLALKRHVMQISGATKCAGMNATNWFVLSAKETLSNEGHAKVSFSCRKSAGITANPA